MRNSKVTRNSFESEEQAEAFLNYPTSRTVAELGMEAIEEFRRKKRIEPKYEHLLDVGCGSGIRTVHMSRYFSRVTAFDVSEAQIAKAKEIENATPSGIDFRVAAAEKIPVDDSSADVITAFFAAQNFALDDFLSECTRILKPNGVAILVGHAREDVAPVDNSIIKPEANPSGAELVKELVGQLQEFARKISHAEFDVLDRYSVLYEKIHGLNKSRDDSKTYSIDMSCKDLRIYAPGIEFYALSESRNMINSFVTGLKEQWGVENIPDDDVKVSVVFRLYIITLSKI